ncbi:DUF58 domain-containing protein|uniref:Uncharacterized conserved protein, DUF58 family, contains vWF domain n=1 Tax=Dendrosporobacter quercicolus TaxID=146817 RepID=A0A1G9UQC8_9FIRM|nr:DUF58 domain-containing protein [Dendrosporobacter quercicolus]NSL48064.1 DUF58 domain-containing protein [Dendrosporobacter quercicolus DSM 1736]SDM62129.1 Uncharacterized conserved protein, DUF58 family, contains vWF domain [Dendrosporobacter quercicolus]
MVFSPRAIALVLGGAVSLFFLVIIAAFTLQQALAFLLLYDGVILGLVLLDLRLTMKPHRLKADRLYEQRMSIGIENAVVLTVGNDGRQDVRVIVKDDIPPEFQAGQNRWEVLLGAGETAKVRYMVKPPKRGDYVFGAIHLRYYSRLGLFMQQMKILPPATAVRVYPNIREISNYQLGRQGNFMGSGVKVSRLAGLGTDFESLRDYRTDDEFRRINWGATARRGRLISNQYEVDRSQQILLVLDAGRLLSGEFDQVTMLDHAINASLLLGYVGITRDDKVGLLTFSDKVKLYLPPGKGQPQLQKILAKLYQLQPELVESDYQAVCQYIGTKNRKRSLVCFFTDLIDEEASKGLIECISILSKHHLVLCITLQDAGIVGKAGICPVNSQEVYEKGIAIEVLRNREKSAALLKQRGVTVLNVTPGELSVNLVNKYLEMKSQLKL